MKKRVGVITFLHNENYGSTLQAWALQKTLNQLGCEAEHIDYRPSKQEKIVNLLRSGNSPALILEGMRKRAVKSSQAGAKQKAASFDAFYAENMRLSVPCRDHAALKKQASCYDLLLSGSDQVWSPVWLNPAYFLDFAQKKQPCAAYAASLGVEKAPIGRKARMMKRLLGRFGYISVREAEGAAIIEQLTGVTPPVLPDPVMLMPREDWLALAEPYRHEKPYLACYFIGNRPDYWEKAAALAQQLSLDIVVLPVTEQAYQQPYTLAAGLSPQAWVGCLAGASHILTDSFHGTAFSCLLGRDFTVLRRYSEDDPESKNSRIDQLMRSLAIDPAKPLDWPAINDKLAALRRQGRQWLQTVIDA